MQVLIVDDDAIALQALKQSLDDAGHDVLIAGDGCEALSIIRESGCRFVISDWLMPNMDGIELCRRIRGEKLPSYVYIILLTSCDGSDHVVDGLSAGADDFMTKPFNPAELCVRIRNAERCMSFHDLERRVAELDEFTYVASHDLQEPIRKLVSFSGLLEKDLQGDLPEAARKDLEFITDAALRMQSLVQALLALSRAGRAAMKREPVSLNTCINRAVNLLSIQIEQGGAEISKGEMPTVLGDETMLTSLFQNLIGNALKFVSKERTPVVTITAEHNGREWVVQVRDNGIGIAPQYADQIFAPFKRLHGRSEYEGSGIGLSICRKTVERHGGSIWVEPVESEGASIKFTLKGSLESEICKTNVIKELSFC